MINKAKQYILDEVIEPIINCEELDNKHKNKIRAKSTKVWIESFKNVGDLYSYLKHSINATKKSDKFVEEVNNLNLKSFEDVIRGFENKFESYLNENMRISDFILGECYTAYDISTYTKNYNIQSGIYLNKNKTGKIESIFIKANFSDGKYPNEWLVENEVLKYYMQSIASSKDKERPNFDINYQRNKAIIESNNIPIYLFKKLSKNKYEFSGNYKYSGWVEEKDNSKWFRLERNNEKLFNNEISLKSYNEIIENEEARISRLSAEERAKERKNNRDKKVERVIIKEVRYVRDPYVVCDALDRANGICEKCKEKAPFIRKKDNTPYLEVHHMVPLSEGGPDTLDNVIAICPNCHRKMHFG